MDNQVLNDGLGSEPINFAAACLLFKSPWWAKAPEEAKHVLRKCKIEIEVFLDLTKPTPPGTRDRIGEHCHRAIVIGFSHKAKNIGKRVRNEGKIPGMRSRKGGDKLAFGLRREQSRENNGFKPIWYLLFDNGEVGLVRNNTLNKWQKMDREEWMSATRFQWANVLAQRTSDSLITIKNPRQKD